MGSASTKAARGGDSYVSDPAKPGAASAAPGEFRRWALGRLAGAATSGHVDGRTDVLTLSNSRCSTEPVRVSGAPIADIVREDDGHRRRFRREADRRLSRRSGDRSRRWAAISWRSASTSSAAAIATASRSRAAIPAGQGAALPLPAADGEPRVPAGAPDHGAGPVVAVPALRPQSAEVCAEHLPRDQGRTISKATVTIERGGAARERGVVAAGAG